LDSNWSRFRVSNWASNSGLIRDAYINRGGGADSGHVLLVATEPRPPRPCLVVPRGPSSPEARRFLPYVWDTSEVLHLEHKDEPHEGIVVKNEHASALHRGGADRDRLFLHHRRATTLDRLS
jgi:hypothetical protein